MPAAIAPIAGAVVGGMMNKSGGGGGSTTASKEPWAEAAPWIKENIGKGQGLQGYYEQNMFNPMQQTAYQNTFTDADQLRSSVAPTMTAFANKLLGQNYQRSLGPGSGAGGTSMLVPGQGQRGLMQQSLAPQAQPGLMGQGSSPISERFAMPGGQQYGAIDFAKLNPYGPGNALDPAKTPAPAAPGATNPNDPNAIDPVTGLPRWYQWVMYSGENAGPGDGSGGPGGVGAGPGDSAGGVGSGGDSAAGSW